MMELAKALKGLRKREKVSQTTLAARLGVNQQSIAYWERNKYEPNLSVLNQLADFFGVSVDYLLGRSSNPNFEYHLCMSEAELIENYREIDENGKEALQGFAAFLKSRATSASGGNIGFQHKTSKSIMSVGGENVQNTINDGKESDK